VLFECLVYTFRNRMVDLTGTSIMHQHQAGSCILDDELGVEALDFEIIDGDAGGMLLAA
jgi:hypothetical protein